MWHLLCMITPFVCCYTSFNRVKTAIQRGTPDWLQTWLFIQIVVTEPYDVENERWRSVNVLTDKDKEDREERTIEIGRAEAIQSNKASLQNKHQICIVAVTSTTVHRYNGIERVKCLLLSTDVDLTAAEIITQIPEWKREIQRSKVQVQIHTCKVLYLWTFTVQQV